MDKKEFPKGLTVKELKKLIANWPELDEDGENTEVWIETSRGLSSIVTEVWPLNKRGAAANIIFCANK